MMAGLLAVFLALGKWMGDHFAQFLTLGAIFVALFKEDWVRRWRSPAFKLRLLPSSPDSAIVPTGAKWEDADKKVHEWSGSVYYFRLWVANEKSWAAERVQVYLRAIHRRVGDNELEELRDFIPMNLRWSHSPTIFETLNPRMEKHCDLGSVWPSSTGIGNLAGMKAGESTFNLAMEVLPNNNCSRLIPGKYRLEILVAAQNARRPRLFYVDLDWNGIFEESERLMLGGSIIIKISRGKL